jgi:tRNA A-37 threonylcarbamoyl transferase component Bud32
MASLHSFSLVHGDLRATNILITGIRNHFLKVLSGILIKEQDQELF